MRIGGLGEVNAKYDPSSKTFSYKPERKLAGGQCFVMVSGMAHPANSQASKVEQRWSFTVMPATSPGANGGTGH